MLTFHELLLIGLAGAAGALCRYFTGVIALKVGGPGFPYGTLIVNVLGCFILALIMGYTLKADVMDKSLRLAITVGFLGAFTTFSTFGYETIRLLDDGAYTAAAANIGANLIIGLAAAKGGLMTARYLAG